ncbi:hypothetical protein J7E88_22820 [Streptomyces sp. ISL-10]|uniref:hypothetical protein n=1 Tax=Streptomyces sp. ISL-10 TaxID=2819172 RepID=UPI001BE7B9CF|nr:hypothetical protein [Streptomyces sp. ISL-10]MBT2368070.1 hypothetical protein [Streptomyces sp. ISL-10]
MAWDEWEQIKADVGNRQSEAMQINHVPVEPGPSVSAVTGGLASSKKAWLTAGDGVGSLRKSIGDALTKLETGQAGLGAQSGCQSAAAQKELYESWKRYGKDVSKRCGSLQKILEQVGHDLLMTDEAVKTEVDKLKAQYADTDAVGGQAKDR